MGKRAKTKSGFSFVLRENVGDDMELLEQLRALDKGDYTLMPDVLVKILGEKQKEKLYDHVRTEDGRVPISEVGKELTEIFSLSKAVKK